MEMCREEVERETYSFKVRLLKANIEEPEVFVKLDLRRHAEKRIWLSDERTTMGEVEEGVDGNLLSGFELYGAVLFQGTGSRDLKYWASEETRRLDKPYVLWK